MVSIETKVVSRHSILGKLSEKQCAPWFLEPKKAWLGQGPTLTLTLTLSPAKLG